MLAHDYHHTHPPPHPPPPRAFTPASSAAPSSPTTSGTTATTAAAAAAAAATTRGLTQLDSLVQSYASLSVHDNSQHGAAEAEVLSSSATHGRPPPSPPPPSSSCSSAFTRSRHVPPPLAPVSLHHHRLPPSVPLSSFSHSTATTDALPLYPALDTYCHTLSRPSATGTTTSRSSKKKPSFSLAAATATATTPGSSSSESLARLQEEDGFVTAAAVCLEDTYDDEYYDYHDVDHCEGLSMGGHARNGTNGNGNGAHHHPAARHQQQQHHHHHHHQRHVSSATSSASSASSPRVEHSAQPLAYRALDDGPLPVVPAPGRRRARTDPLHNPDDTSNVYVRLLPSHTTDALLHALGERFGRVRSVRALVHDDPEFTGSSDDNNNTNGNGNENGMPLSSPTSPFSLPSPPPPRPAQSARSGGGGGGDSAGAGGQPDDGGERPRCTGVGFVLYENKHEAKHAIVALNAVGFDASFARESITSKLKRFSDPDSTNLYFSNLPRSWGENELIALLAPARVLSVRLLKNTSSSSSLSPFSPESPAKPSSPTSGKVPGRGVGFALLASRTEAEEVITRLQGARVPGALLPLQVRFADSPEQKAFKAVHRGTEPSVAVASALASDHVRRTRSHDSFAPSSPGSAPPSSAFTEPSTPTSPSTSIATPSSSPVSSFHGSSGHLPQQYSPVQRQHAVRHTSSSLGLHSLSRRSSLSSVNSEAPYTDYDSANSSPTTSLFAQAPIWTPSSSPTQRGHNPTAAPFTPRRASSSNLVERAAAGRARSATIAAPLDFDRAPGAPPRSTPGSSNRTTPRSNGHHHHKQVHSAGAALMMPRTPSLLPSLSSAELASAAATPLRFRESTLDPDGLATLLAPWSLDSKHYNSSSTRASAGTPTRQQDEPFSPFGPPAFSMLGAESQRPPLEHSSGSSSTIRTSQFQSPLAFGYEAPPPPRHATHFVIDEIDDDDDDFSPQMGFDVFSSAHQK